MSSPRQFALALPIFLGFGISFCACKMGSGCGRPLDSASPRWERAGQSSAGGERAEAAALPTIAPGQGVISGEVLLSGAHPPMQPLKRGADPACAKGAAMDEQVLVRMGKFQNAVVRV